MFGFVSTEYDKKVYREELFDFLPSKIIDIHVHVWEKGTRLKNNEEKKGAVGWVDRVGDSLTYEDMQATFYEMFPGKKVGAVLFGMPTYDLDTVNAYAKKCIQEHGNPGLWCTSYNSSEEEITEALKSGFCGIKPYLSNCPPEIVPSDITIYDFLPKEHLELMNRTGGVVMLHIPRALRLRDPVNLKQMMEIDENYPNAKVIIAHIGRAYIESDIGNAFEILKRSKNLLFDFTANTYAKAIYKCIETVGADRLMFGSDLPITKMRMYRTEENGHYVNVVPRGLYGDVKGDKNMRETADYSNMTHFMYEELRGFKSAAEQVGLGRSDIEKIMYTNASRLFKYEI